jgi:hypothetical protein
MRQAATSASALIRLSVRRPTTTPTDQKASPVGLAKAPRMRIRAPSRRKSATDSFSRSPS